MSGDVAALTSIIDGPGSAGPDVRTAAAMMYLWGINRVPKSLLPEPVSGEYDNDALAMFLLSNTYERGNMGVAEDLETAGLEMEKSWLAVGDDKVCDVCRANAAEGWIPLGQTFSGGVDRPLQHPACRCCALYRRKGAER